MAELSICTKGELNTFTLLRALGSGFNFTRILYILRYKDFGCYYPGNVETGF